MVEPSRQNREPFANGQAARYSTAGHPSIEQLMKEQRTGPVADLSALRGDFWPEDDSIEEFLETLHEWRGHTRTGPAA